MGDNESELPKKTGEPPLSRSTPLAPDAVPATSPTPVAEPVTPFFGTLTQKEVEEALTNLREQTDLYRKETSSAVRQFALGGLAVIWLFKSTTGRATDPLMELPPGLMLATFFLVLALALDFAYWAVGAVYWGLDRRYHFRENCPWWAKLLMKVLTRVETVSGVPAVRLRISGYLMSAEILFTALGCASLLQFLAKRVLF
jgi:hypothetical protein